MLNVLLADGKEHSQFVLSQLHVLAQSRTRASKGLLSLVMIGMGRFHLGSLFGVQERSMALRGSTPVSGGLEEEYIPLQQT
jgi:hypothetical protein